MYLVTDCIIPSFEFIDFLADLLFRFLEDILKCLNPFRHDSKN